MWLNAGMICPIGSNRIRGLRGGIMIAKTKTLVAALFAALSLVAPVIAAQPLTKVIMTTGSFSEREAAMYVAQDQGFFRRYGLELTFVQVRSGPVGMAAIASGETQLHEGSATGAVLSAAAEGLDLVFVAGMINKLIGNIMATPKIKSPADLKGKTIGGCQISEKHSAFFINIGNAKAEHVIMLISDVKMRVRNQLGIQLEEEIRYLGFD
jgi:ABC-type nitrate/sulfonate/bicarbonate transport system substrate-binding protein